MYFLFRYTNILVLIPIQNSQDITMYINAQLSMANELKENLSSNLGLINYEKSYTVLDQILGILFVFQGVPLWVENIGNTNNR